MPFQAVHRENSMQFRGGRVIDSYTGYPWCFDGLHLLTPERPRCSCQARKKAMRRRVARKREKVAA